ncbi:sarcosine oxidase subunit gamma [Sedimentitalea todarodis]|uniref:Sarcosine oxidase subunit gamma n=1 Tax=Sedimentitalea todarodis TaxID=1631240 RepID=A0ABU3VBF6_9RHOB|nr:sarcosine oxidase subunit gamma [Sedimentitalea todarodis]MDU9003510.1 sarcosine oxidase subunit gamma [Sedimentitalea todarodis]
MADLIARTPCKGMLPLEIGGAVLRECDVGRMTSISPFKGQQAAVSDLLNSVHGVGLPGPNRTSKSSGCHVIWFARGQVLLMGADPDPALARHAALTDQSDAWAVVALEGARAEDVLARLVPVDLRGSTFKIGHTLRTQVMHMHASVIRIATDTFQIMVFRSMAETLVHDLRSAMEGVAARG